MLEIFKEKYFKKRSVYWSQAWWHTPALWYSGGGSRKLSSSWPSSAVEQVPGKPGLHEHLFLNEYTVIGECKYCFIFFFLVQFCGHPAVAALDCWEDVEGRQLSCSGTFGASPASFLSHSPFVRLCICWMYFRYDERTCSRWALNGSNGLSVEFFLNGDVKGKCIKQKRSHADSTYGFLEWSFLSVHVLLPAVGRRQLDWDLSLKSLEQGENNT